MDASPATSPPEPYDHPLTLPELLELESELAGVRVALENGQLVEQDGFAGPCPCGLRTLDECECAMGWER